MAELLSPNPRQKAPMASRLQSPTSPFFLGSNDDKLERAQARAARAAAMRRKSIIPGAFRPTEPDSCLDKRQIFELFQNCIKLASENKINQKNTWELNLIDHLTEIIKVEEENDTETNFQKASCTLEAGVKIYSLRVDSVHSEAYKVLGGMNRAGHENEPDTPESTNADSGKEATSKKDMERKISPFSTLESSFEALNVKKFDVAFAVDPLYHQTSAQFDEGGAKGLLMNNLGVYGECRVLFDSLEVPGKCIPCDEQQEKSNIIDISFAKDCVEQMVLNMQNGVEISPTLRHIVIRFNEDNRRPSDCYTPAEKPAEDDMHNEAEFENGSNEDCVTWSCDQDDETTMEDGGHIFADSSFPDYQEENEPNYCYDHDTEDRFDKVDEYLFSSLGISSKQNSWAGPEHWKYQKVKATEADAPKENGSEATSKRKKNQKKVVVELDFMNSMDKDFSDIFAPPKNPKSLLLPANKEPCKTKLPEDCHYQPEDLVKLFLLPSVKCIGRRCRKSSDESRQQNNDFEQFSSWDNGSVHSAHFDDGNFESDEESSTLVSQPRQINKIEVQYDKTSKQVDVQILKETLWDQLQESHQIPTQDEEAVSFKEMLARFPRDCNAATTIDEVSPHLCFICLLHLANEHGLRIQDNPDMDDLKVHFPHLSA